MRAASQKKITRFHTVVLNTGEQETFTVLHKVACKKVFQMAVFLLQAVELNNRVYKCAFSVASGDLPWCLCTYPIELCVQNGRQPG